MKFFVNASSFSKKKLYISTPFFCFSIPFLGKGIEQQQKQT